VPVDLLVEADETPIDVLEPMLHLLEASTRLLAEVVDGGLQPADSARVVFQAAFEAGHPFFEARHSGRLPVRSW
jgi:hypothetical protein